VPGVDRFPIVEYNIGIVTQKNCHAKKPPSGGFVFKAASRRTAFVGKRDFTVKE
jgi:hypothetical protein